MAHYASLSVIKSEHFEASLTDGESSESDHGVFSAADMEDNDVSVCTIRVISNITMNIISFRMSHAALDRL